MVFHSLVVMKSRWREGCAQIQINNERLRRVRSRSRIAGWSQLILVLLVFGGRGLGSLWLPEVRICFDEFIADIALSRVDGVQLKAIGVDGRGAEFTHQDLIALGHDRIELRLLRVALV